LAWRGSRHRRILADKPVLAINTTTYWRALRRNGPADKIDGLGALLEH
jgi:maleate isomerase